MGNCVNFYSCNNTLQKFFQLSLPKVMTALHMWLSDTFSFSLMHNSLTVEIIPIFCIFVNFTLLDIVLMLHQSQTHSLSWSHRFSLWYKKGWHRLSIRQGYIFLHRIQILFLTHTWWFTIMHNTSPRAFHAIQWHWPSDIHVVHKYKQTKHHRKTSKSKFKNS